MNQDNQNQGAKQELQVPVMGYLALIFAIIFFSGIFANAKGWQSALDFNTINGKFGTMKDAAKATFAGMGGSGVRDGFLFALGLIPGVMLALGIIEIIDHLGGLKAAQKLLTPVLRPLLGIPGIAGLALISSLQSTDAGAGMTKALREAGAITEKEKTVFCAFQFSAGGTITNYLTTGGALFSFLTVPIILPLAVIFVMKVFGANLMRLYLNKFVKEDLDNGKQIAG
ncbi:nucleoside recognition domain-containing protein [Sporolituus thermophilus]|uniref:Nucleoside recognition n=1 Tax=Sporolituus thermophilus DSM 23256 TaxID=1123285 RepID=A0A1G7HTD6_9FIRM|nr:nucleoside recognition domain-containing protein [Sporolituus thermophilus]SDF03524.1 Nucleoside recognition [Sporolituus thermophilus DSM 23256]